MGRKKAKSGIGGQLLMLGVLVAILGGAGAWNYQRNLAEEAKEPRPYRSLSDADLQQLRAAYEGEIARLDPRYQKASQQRVRVSKGGHHDDRVREFERVQRHSRSVRELSYGLAEKEAAVTDGRVILLVSPAMHSTETAGSQFGMEFAYLLATSDEEPWALAREEVVVVIFPCTNPDGVDHGALRRRRLRRRRRDEGHDDADRPQHGSSSAASVRSTSHRSPLRTTSAR